MLKLLIDYDAKLLNEKDSNKSTPLLLACSSSKRPNLTAAFLLEQSGIEVNSKNHTGKTPLYEACARNYFEVVQKLLEKKANHLTLESGLGHLPLHAACSYNNPSLVQALLEAGRAEVCMRYKTIFGQTPLDIAFEHKTDQLIKFLLNFARNNNYLPAKIMAKTDLKAVKNWVKINCAWPDEQKELLSFLKITEPASPSFFKIKTRSTRNTVSVQQNTPTP